jgi:hypothetical protein
MSSAHNLPEMAAAPHFTKKIDELGLKMTNIKKTGKTVPTGQIINRPTGRLIYR